MGFLSLMIKQNPVLTAIINNELPTIQYELLIMFAYTNKGIPTTNAVNTP